MAGALAGMRVLEFGEHVSAPYAARLLAGLGAEVVKVEVPSGDPERLRGPFQSGVEDSEAGTMFLYLNRGKSGVVLDLEDVADRERFNALVGWCDIFVHNLAPARAKALGLTFERLRAVNPAIVFASITPFGLTGPHRDYNAYELTTMHGGGWAWLSPGQLEDRSLPPLKTAGRQGEIQAAHSAVIAITAAWTAHAEHPVTAQQIDISVQEVLADNTFNTGVLTYALTGAVADRYGRAPFGPSGLVPCSDGAAFIVCVEEYQWHGLVEILGNPEWVNEEGFETALSRGRNNERLLPRIAERTATMTMQEFYHATHEHRVPCGPLSEMRHVLDYEQFKARGFWETMSVPGDGNVTVPGAPYRPALTPWTFASAAPRKGEHGDRIFAEVATARRRPAPTPRPPRPLLEGVRVLDVTTQWAGPAASKILARFGAEVIRVEWGQRVVAPGQAPVSGLTGAGGHHHGKKWALVNFKHPRGLAIARDLAAKSDILIDNFAAGVIAARGLDFETIRARNPRFVMVSASGFGLTGPHRDFLSYGRPQSYLSGFIALTGYAGGRPRELGIPYGDPNAAQLIVIAALAAYNHAQRTGEGQFVDIAQTEGLATCIVESLLEYQATGVQPPRRGNRDRLLCPHNSYPCAGDDRWMTIACGSEAEWQALVDAIGLTSLRAERFATRAGRKSNEDDLDAIISEWTRTRDRWDVTRALQAAGVAAFPTMDGRDLVLDAHLQSREFLKTVRLADGTPYVTGGLPWVMDGLAPAERLLAPEVGQHTREVLASVLGLSEATLDELEAEDTIRQARTQQPVAASS